jgi:hypothetical protein
VEVFMIARYSALSRIAALAVASTLFAAPIASAQSRDSTASGASAANTTLLSPSAFARLAQPAPAETAHAPVLADSPRPSLLRQGTAAMARQAQAQPAQNPAAPSQKSWIRRHKAVYLVPAVLAGIIFGTYGLVYLIYGDD